MRFEDWPMRLSRFITESCDKEFKYGEHDCFQFMSKAVFTMTGEDFSSEYDKYSTKEEAEDIIKKNGGMMAVIKKHLGSPLPNVLKGKRGDVCLVKAPRLVGGVIDDTGSNIVLLTEKGIIKKKINEAFYVWRV